MENLKKRMSSELVSFALIGAVTLLLFANTLQNGFVYDDAGFIVNNERIRNLQNIGDFFTSSRAFSAKGDFLIYRPLATLSFALDYKIWKLNPSGYHIMNIIFHCLSGIMVYAVLKLLFRDSLAALFSALLFIAHPAQTEAVTWISGRANGMSFFFFLLAFYLFIKKRNILSLCIYALSLLSKESAVVFPLVLVMYYLYCLKEKRNIKAYIPFFILTILYILFRHAVLGRTSQRGLWGDGVVPTFLTMSKVFLFYYIRFTTLPVGLCVDRDIPLSFSVLEPAVLISVLAIALILFLIAAFYKRSKIISFGMLWFLITLLPVSNIIPLQTLFAERFLYMPSVGFCLILSSAVFTRDRKPASVLLAVLVVLFGSFTISRNRDWKDELSLWTATVRESRNSYTAYYNLGISYFRAGRYTEALESYKQALRLYPYDGKVYYDLAVSYMRMGREGEALELLMKAVYLTPDYAPAYYNMGLIYTELGNYKEAIKSYREVIRIEPHNLDAHYRLCSAYISDRNDNSAWEHYLALKNINRNMAERLYNMLGH